MFEFKDLTKEEYKTIAKIAARAVKLYGKAGVKLDYMSTDMDICAVHQSNPLRLDEFLKADAFNFAHDITGIANHLNRTTGKLERFFLPRFTK